MAGAEQRGQRRRHHRRIESVDRRQPRGDGFLLLLLRRRQIRADALEYLRGHADALAQRRVRVDRLADVGGVAAHLHREADLAHQVAGVRADDAAADAAVRRLVEQQLGEAFVAAVGDGALDGMQPTLRQTPPSV